MSERLSRFFWTALAAIFLVEAWLWDVLGACVGALVAMLPIEPLRRALRRLIETLPPTFALLLFVIPVLVVLPCKIVGLALIAKGRLMGGAAVFLLAKTAGLGVTAFVFDLCRDRLLALRWFARLYATMIAWRDWAHARLAPYRESLRAALARLRARLSSGAPALARKLAALRALAHARRRQAL